MKKLFAIIATLVVAACAFNAKAQLSGIEGMPPYKLGVTVGLNMPWMSGSGEVSVTGADLRTNTYTGNYKLTTGFQVGANLMVDASELIPNTFVRVETKYSMKGAQSKISYLNHVQEENITTHYIEIPVHYGYAWYINDDISLMAETGPYVAMGFSGTCKIKQDGVQKPNAGVFDGILNGNRFDLGWGVQGSVMIAKNYQVHVGFDYGFININKHFLQNRNISVGFTWFFESLFE